MTNPPSAAAGPFAALMNRPYLVLVLTNLFWGGNLVAGKLAVGHIDPYLLMLIRWIGALILVLPFAIGPLRRSWPTLRRYWPLYLFYGAIGYASFNMLMYVSAYLTSGVNMSIEQVTINIFVMALNFAIFRIGVRPLQLFGAALTILGVALTATEGDLGRILSLTINAGDGLVLFACVIWAIYSLTLRYRPTTDWLSFLVMTCIGATLASLVFQLAFGGGLVQLPSHLAAVTWRGWLIALYTIVFPSVLAQMLYVRGVELIGANRASLFINLLPLFGTVGSVLLVGESLQLFHYIAGALIAVGIVLAEWSARRAQIVVSEP
ncbi:MAG TPA: DMT family transporter [Alphaproteobacteria bacterium]|nr:DMT family transporter [Alphaproteobacteria bacterium]